MQSNLSKIKNVENDPYISDAEKLRIARQIQGDTTATAKIFDKFTQSEEYEKMPTEAELQQIRKMEKDAENAAMLSETEDTSEVNEENASEDIVNENIDETGAENIVSDKNDRAENLVLDAKSKEKEAINGDDAVMAEMQAIVSKLNKDKETGGTIDIYA